VQQIRNHRPRARRERPWQEALPPDPRDPDAVRARPRSHRPVTAARTTRPGSGSMRSKPMILVALLLAAFR